MSQKMSRLHMQLAPTLALPRKRGRARVGERADEVIR